MAKKNVLLWILLILMLIVIIYFATQKKEPETQPLNGQEDEQEEYCEDYPNFIGTPRVGDVCMDTLDCTNHPPTNYEGGYIECIETGKCRYNC